MFNVGEIVCHDNLKFNDNQYDEKENRPCVVLFSINKGDRVLICTAPLTSSVTSFNKNCIRYHFIPEVVYNYRKLNFVSLENIAFHSDKDTHSTGVYISVQEVEKIIEKFKKHKPRTDKLRNMYDEIMNYIMYIELFKILEEKEIQKENKTNRNLKRKLAKRQNNPEVLA